MSGVAECAQKLEDLRLSPARTQAQKDVWPNLQCSLPSHRDCYNPNSDSCIGCFHDAEDALEFQGHPGQHSNEKAD